MSSHNVLVLATGDGDCAAHALLKRCRSHEVGERWWVSLLADSQLRVEHAISLTRADLCVFLQEKAITEAKSAAGKGSTAAPSYDLRALTQDSGHHMPSSGSDLSPEDLLHTLAILGRHGGEPGCYVLSLQPGATDDAALEDALMLLADLLEHPEAAYWNSRLS